MINKYKFVNTEFLLYNPDGPIPNLGDHLELTEENINLELNIKDQLLPINYFIDFILAGTGKKRTRDKILEENGITTFYDLQCAYNLVRTKDLQTSFRVRKFVVEKYSEIINLVWEPLAEKIENVEEDTSEILKEKDN